MSVTTVILIYLTGCVVAWRATRTNLLRAHEDTWGDNYRKEWTWGDEYFAIFLSIGSWVSLATIAIVNIILSYWRIPGLPPASERVYRK